MKENKEEYIEKYIDVLKKIDHYANDDIYLEFITIENTSIYALSLRNLDLDAMSYDFYYIHKEDPNYSNKDLSDFDKYSVILASIELGDYPDLEDKLNQDIHLRGAYLGMLELWQVRLNELREFIKATHTELNALNDVLTPSGKERKKQIIEAIKPIIKNQKGKKLFLVIMALIKKGYIFSEYGDLSKIIRAFNFLGASNKNNQSVNKFDPRTIKEAEYKDIYDLIP